MRALAPLLALVLLVALALVARSPAGSGAVTSTGADSAPATETGDPEIEALEGTSTARVAAAAVDGAGPLPEADSALEPHFRIEGIVLVRHADGSLHPAVGRGISIGFGDQIATTTGPDGRFVHELESRGRGPASMLLRVPAVEGDPLLAHARRLDFPFGVSTLDDIRVVLCEPPAIVGRAVDLDGEPLAGVRVTLGGAEDTTGPDGAFDLGQPDGIDYDMPHSIAAEIEAVAAGATLLHCECPGFDPDGAWRPMQLVLGPVGELVLRVVEADGAPRPGETVTLTLAPSEPWFVHYDVVLQFELERLRAETDDDGVAHFTGVPAGLHLALDALGAEYVDHEGGRVVEGGPAAQPIVVPAGGTLDLEARAPRTLHVRGRVREPNGDPSPNARLRFFDGESEWLCSELRAADDGTFDASVPIPAVGNVVDVVAQSVVGERPSYGMFGSTHYPDPRVRGVARVTFGEDDEAHEVTIDLAPRPNVVGSVLGPDGALAQYARVTLVPDGAPSRLHLPEGEWASKAAHAGTFEFTGVAPGRYVVVAESVGLGRASSAPFVAGAGEVEVRFAKAEPARIEVVVEGVRQGPEASLRLTYGSVDHLRGIDVPPQLDPETRFTGVGGDPRTELGIPAHRKAVHGANYSADLLVQHFRPEESFEITAVPGPFVLGVDGVDGAGQRLAPLGVGLVSLVPGTYRIVLAPRATGTLELTVLDAGPGEAVEVLGADGRTVHPVLQSGPIHARTRLSSRGAATLRLPQGEHELAIGRADALERGVARIRLPVRIVAGEVLRIRR